MVLVPRKTGGRDPGVFAGEVRPSDLRDPDSGPGSRVPCRARIRRQVGPGVGVIYSPARSDGGDGEVLPSAPQPRVRRGIRNAYPIRH